MPPKKQPTVWKAEPHTIAKIEILEKYLERWFTILGMSARGNDLLYVDGFSGPGRYTNYPTGSPIAALRAAAKVRSSMGARWTAGDIHCAFVESDLKRFEHLRDHLEVFSSVEGLVVHLFHDTFVNGLVSLKTQLPHFFSTSRPLMVFIDPFGATGAPYSVVSDLLSSGRSEVLINFDTDAVVRIFEAGTGAGHERILRDIYGDDSWKELEQYRGSFTELCRLAVANYKRRLRSIAGVKYVFAFEMRDRSNTLEYHLVFASQHPKGLQKMKEAMQEIDQAGDYTFSDGHVGRQTLFRFDDPQAFATVLHSEFSGRTAPYEEVIDYALNETPFTNAKKMLRLLEKQNLIQVESTDSKRKRGTFPEQSVKRIIFS
jgi:three-Cys-motif partner protein